MDTSVVDLITAIISNFGFPIAVCGVLFWYIIQKDKAAKDDREQFTGALDRNTEALLSLKDEIKCGKS